MKTEIVKPSTQKISPKRLMKFSLICGVLSSVLYVIMNIIAVAIYNGYDPVSQTVSELSAIAAPTRSFWVPLGFVYTLLVALFGWGVWQSAGNNRSLRMAGMLLLMYGIIGLGWPPMHQREVLAAGGGSFTDTMHIIYSAVTVFLMLLAMWFGSKSFDKPFRFYSVVSIGTLIILGAWTAMEAPKLQHNQPTPWLGLIERILIFIFLLWIVVLAVLLLRTKMEKYNQGEEKLNEFAGFSVQNKLAG
jgi:cell division protein FtsL